MPRLGRSRPARDYLIIERPTVTVVTPITMTGAMSFSPAISASGFLPVTTAVAMSFSPAIAAVDSETIVAAVAMSFSPALAGSVTVANPVTLTAAMSFSPAIAGSVTEVLNPSGFGIISQWNGSLWVPYQAGIAAGSSSIFPNTVGITELVTNLVYAGIVDATVINGATFQGTNWLENPSGSFIYSGTPATGNLLSSIAPSSGTDSHSNAYNAGVYSYGPSGSYVGLTESGGFAILDMFPPGPLTSSTNHPSIESRALNAGAVNEQSFIVMTSGKESGNVDAAVQVFSASADNTLNASVTFEFGGTIYSTITQSAVSIFGVPLSITSQAVPAVVLTPTSNTHVSNPTEWFSSLVNANAVNEQLLVVLTSGKESSQADAAIQLFSASADNTAAATAKIEFGGAVGLTVTSGGISAPNYSSGHNAAGWPIGSGATIATVSGSNCIIASGFLGALNNLRNACVASGAIT